MRQRGIGAILLPDLGAVLNVIRYLLLAQAFVFTSVHREGAADCPTANVGKGLAQVWAWGGTHPSTGLSQGRHVRERAGSGKRGFSPIRVGQDGGQESREPQRMQR